MAIYQNFAKVYDIFMDNVPYDSWVKYIQAIFKKFGLSPACLAELGCGTGNITNRFANLGYEVIGVDLSEEMLCIAKEKSDALNLENIIYINQDMKELSLHKKVDCILSMCDSLNYITEKSDLFQVFQKVHSHLNKNGIFVFDINTVHKFKNILSDNNFCETNDFSAYTWENYFDEEEMINEFYTNFFIKDENSNLYHRFEEFHYEKAYEIETIKNLIKNSGFKLLGVYEENTFDKPNDTSERVFFVATKLDL